MVEETKPAGVESPSQAGSGGFRAYKPEQGRYSRLTAFWCLLFLGAYGCYRLRFWLETWGDWFQTSWSEDPIPVLGWTLNPAVVLSAGVFAIYWMWLWWFLNRPKSADLLIETEGELKKVTWPTFKESVDSSIVVIGTVLFLVVFTMAADKVLGSWIVDYLLFRKV